MTQAPHFDTPALLGIIFGVMYVVAYAVYLITEKKDDEHERR